MTNGDLLGDWTDELDGNKMIGTFVSGGPKNYSYETEDFAKKTTEDFKKGDYIGNTYHTKVKGFNLNYQATLKINHLRIIDLVKENLEDPENLDEHKIKIELDTLKRNKDHSISNLHQTKRYGLVYDKRTICLPDADGNYDTLPFGFK
tara:strand:+ start:212 stop:655 length:444 start_codon:yes stop_codon:yes gene_type:complete